MIPEVREWLLTIFQGITAAGVLYGIWAAIQTRQLAVNAARRAEDAALRAAAHAIDAVAEIKQVVAKVEEVHVATNSLTDRLVAASEAVGEKREIDRAAAAAAAAAAARE